MATSLVLKAVCVGTGVFGAAMLLAPAATRAGYGLLFFGDAAAMATWPEAARWYVTLMHGVLGAVMVGWAVALLRVLSERGAPWHVVAWSVLCWFVPDTLFSAWVHAWPNVALNTGFGLLFAVGLWLARPRATRTTTRHHSVA